jgi:hypothetical protein
VFDISFKSTVTNMATARYLVVKSGKFKANRICILLRYSLKYSLWVKHSNGFDQPVARHSSENTVQHAIIEAAVFSVVQTDAPIDWLDSDHVIYVYCRSMSVPRLYK